MSSEHVQYLQDTRGRRCTAYIRTRDGVRSIRRRQKGKCRPTPRGETLRDSLSPAFRHIGPVSQGFSVQLVHNLRRERARRVTSSMRQVAFRVERLILFRSESRTETRTSTHLLNPPRQTIGNRPNRSQKHQGVTRLRYPCCFWRALIGLNLDLWIRSPTLYQLS